MSLAKDFPRFEIDQSAETVAELMAGWPRSEYHLRQFIAVQVSSGRWELVYKRVGNTHKPAYRRAKR